MKIVIKDVKKTYKQGNIVVEALKPCNFEINDGEQIAITGTSVRENLHFCICLEVWNRLLTEV